MGKARYPWRQVGAERRNVEFPREFQAVGRLGVPSWNVRSWGAWCNGAITRWPNAAPHRQPRGFLELNQSEEGV